MEYICKWILKLASSFSKNNNNNNNWQVVENIYDC